jgi:hypothetical protein
LQPSWEEIAALTDPVLRNLWITQRYHEIASALHDCGAGMDATWCTFAVWASKTAGAVIRGDDLPQLIRSEARDRAGDHVDRFNREAPRLAPVGGQLGDDHLTRFAKLVAADVSRYMADGNRLVFAELAPPFEAVVNGWTRGSQSAFAAALAALPSGSEGQSLAVAFGAYRQAFGCDLESADRPLRFLTANVMAVAHEQQRLQPAIKSALDAAVHDTFLRVIEDDILAHVPGPARRLLDHLVDDLADALEDACQVAITQTLVRLITADERLDLCFDLPPLGGVMWPPGLTLIDSSAAAYEQWDRTGGTGRPTGANDWADLGERMNYIVNLFRSRQRHGALLDSPFTSNQLDDLRQGHVPAGPL